VDLGTLPEGGYESVANGVNQRGQVIGFALNTIPDSFSFIGFPTETRAFLWQDGIMKDIGTLGGPDAIAGFINDQGEVVGPSYTAERNPNAGIPVVHPFLWRDGRMIDLGSLGGMDSEPTGLNERGQVIGLSTLAGETTTHPFLWSNGRIHDLGTLGGDNGTANWINDHGDVVGRADLGGPTPQLHDAVLWTEGKAADLGVLPGDACSNAYFVNAHGQVVGTSENEHYCSIPVGQHAFLWEAGRPMVDLNTLVQPGTNLTLTYAVAINERGEIAGLGVPAGCAVEDVELCGHAFLLIPCGPRDRCEDLSAPMVDGQAEPATGAEALPSAATNTVTSAFQQRLNAMRSRIRLVRKRATGSE